MNTHVASIRQSARRWLTLLIAPSAISLAAIIITNTATAQATPSWLWVSTGIAAIVSFLLYGIGYRYDFEDALSNLARRLRSQRFRKPRVLILDGTINGEQNQSPPTAVHSDRAPIDWRTAFESLGWRVELGPNQQVLREPLPDIVVNPFGEVYPEADFVSSKTASDMRSYVWNGGIYVNVAGIPFWYRYDPTSRKRETAGRVEGIFEEKAIWKSLFYDLFPSLSPVGDPELVTCTQSEDDIKRFGDITNAGGAKTVKKFRAYAIQSALIPLLRDEAQQFYVIGAYLYGQGSFIIAGIQIAADEVSFRKVIAAVRGWAGYELKGRKP